MLKYQYEIPSQKSSIEISLIAGASSEFKLTKHLKNKYQPICLVIISRMSVCGASCLSLCPTFSLLPSLSLLLHRYVPLRSNKPQRLQQPWGQRLVCHLWRPCNWETLRSLQLRWLQRVFQAKRQKEPHVLLQVKRVEGNLVDP